MKTLVLEIIWMVKWNCLLLKYLNTQNGNEFGLLHKPWDYFVWSIKVTPNHGVTLIDLLCKFIGKGHFYLKNKFQEICNKNFLAIVIWINKEEIRMFFIQEHRDIIVSLNTEIFWKALEIDQSNPVSWYAISVTLTWFYKIENVAM